VETAELDAEIAEEITAPLEDACPVVEAAEEPGMMTVMTPVEVSVVVLVVTPSEHVKQGTVVVIVTNSVVTLVVVSEPVVIGAVPLEETTWLVRVMFANGADEEDAEKLDGAVGYDVGKLEAT